MYLTPRPGNLRDNQLMSHKELLSTRYRILSLSGVIGASDVDACDILYAMDAESDKPIKVFVSSPGGLVDVAMNIHDTFKLLRSPVITVGRFCASAAAILLAGGTPGQRYLLPSSRVMLHSPSGGVSGSTEDIAVQAREIRRLQDLMVDILLADGVKRSREEILNDIERDMWMCPADAIKYGLADTILTPAMMQSWLRQ
jgi:ATP-dependent Clp protease protease subunit